MSDNVITTCGLGEVIADCNNATAQDQDKKAQEILQNIGFAPITGDQLLQKTFPPVEWIVEDLLAARGGTSRGFKGDIIGGSKTRKTFFALQLAECVATGKDFLCFEVPKARKVLYLDFELREDFLQERLKAPAESFGSLDNLHFVKIIAPYRLRNKYNQNGDLNSEDVESAVIKEIDQQGYELIIIDPIYKLLQTDGTSREDENSGQGMNGLLRWRDRIITETKAACLFVHHDTKSDGEDQQITARGAGSGYLGRDYDTRFALSRHKDGDDCHMVLEAGCRVRKDPKNKTIVFDLSKKTFKVDDTIPAERKTKKKKNESPAITAPLNREKAKTATLKMFEDLEEKFKDPKYKAEAEKPEAHLLLLNNFRSLLEERAIISGREVVRQEGILKENGVLAKQKVLKKKGDKTCYEAEGKYYIGPAEWIGKYRASFGLDPDGDEMRDPKAK